MHFFCFLKNKDLVDNGTFILPDYAIITFQMVKLGKNWLAYIFWLAKRTEEPKFHVSNSRNKKNA